MRKRGRRFIPFLLIIVIISVFGISHILELIVPIEVKGEERIISAQNLEREGKQNETDSSYIQLLKQLKVKVDSWLKDLNERIERGDITRFEVRFLEILRNILEWMKEKIDAKIESSEKKIPGREVRGLSQETHRIIFPFWEVG